MSANIFRSVYMRLAHVVKAAGLSSMTDSKAQVVCICPESMNVPEGFIHDYSNCQAGHQCSSVSADASSFSSFMYEQVHQVCEVGERQPK